MRIVLLWRLQARPSLLYGQTMYHNPPCPRFKVGGDSFWTHLSCQQRSNLKRGLPTYILWSTIHVTRLLSKIKYPTTLKWGKGGIVLRPMALYNCKIVAAVSNALRLASFFPISVPTTDTSPDLVLTRTETCHIPDAGSISLSVTCISPRSTFTKLYTADTTSPRITFLGFGLGDLLGSGRPGRVLFSIPWKGLLYMDCTAAEWKATSLDELGPADGGTMY